MRITLIAVGKLKEGFWRDAAEEYLKRLRPYADVRVVEVADRDSGRLGDRLARAEEATDVLKAVPAASHVVSLDVTGIQLTSEAFSAHLAQLGLEGRSNVTFIIGGSVGLDPAVIARSDERLSLGSMTLPHNLARVVLLEQLYRAFRIMRGEPYHK